jgi:dihydroflavonol-4-reductase
MIKVLVTGASGLLATNTIIALLDNGYHVVALLRNKGMFLLPVQRNLEIREGNFTDPVFLEESMQGCGYVIHAAAETRQDLTGYDEYFKVNVTGTETVLRIADKCNVKRVVIVSTANVFGFGTLDRPGNESSEIMRPYSDSLYVKSKSEAHRMALAYSGKPEIIMVNPTFLIGPYDKKPGSGRIIILGYKKKFLFYPPGGKNFVHVADAASGIVNALSKGDNKESFLLANENLSYREFFQKVSVHSESKPVFIRIPRFILLAAGIFGSTLRYFGVRTELTLTNMKILCVKNYYSGKKAEKVLEIKYTPLEIAIAEAINWFRLNKKIV